MWRACFPCSWRSFANVSKMIQYRESSISAYHNYLVNDMLTPGFVVGDSSSEGGFFFLADLILPGGPIPCISARLMDERGGYLVELHKNEIRGNPGGCIKQGAPDGFCILLPSGGPLLEINTRGFANGYLTVIKARLFDEGGELRMEPFGESVRLHGEAKVVLNSPFASS